MATTVTVLDGGLGTALEDSLGKEVAHCPLWSTQAVISHAAKLVEVHLKYLQAGARIIESATYQASVPSLNQAGFNDPEARKIMFKAVHLAREARSQFTGTRGTGACIALSLGPFGATLRPTQEFEGFYPPPYGPKAYEPNGGNYQSFDLAEDEISAVDALARFHLERLLTFCSDIVVWDAVRYLAFETVLLPREVSAIRRAVRLLEEHLTAHQRIFDKPWWISFVFPGGSLSGVKCIVDAALQSNGEPVPIGLGINCTPLDKLLPLTLELSRTAAKYQSSSSLLVLYPNGGTYDTVNRRWLPKSVDADIQWASTFKKVICEVLSAFPGSWKDIFAGGCCGTNPAFIQRLSIELSSKECKDAMNMDGSPLSNVFVAQ